MHATVSVTFRCLAQGPPSERRGVAGMLRHVRLLNLRPPLTLPAAPQTPASLFAIHHIPQRGFVNMPSFAGMDAQINQLRQQVQATEAQLRDLKDQLDHAERVREVERIHSAGFAQPWLDEALSAVGWEKSDLPMQDQQHFQNGFPQASPRWPLAQEEYQRYGRQLIMPEVGLEGQLKLKNAKVLVVGVGGLGCPAAAYLAGAGVGTLGLMDGDTVEASNLHRQIAHSNSRIGMSKVQSACEYLKAYVEHLVLESVSIIFLITISVSILS